ncbi:MAG: DUF2520 domain-containing protein [Rubricoccaceae bacterium]|nr:DUF2520 domain-containing protein [Rubricoccaceae bacterium]
MAAYASIFKAPRPVTAIVGSGAVARVLALRMVDKGYPVEAIISRTCAHAEDLARSVGAKIGSDSYSDLPPDVQLIVICVADSALPYVAESLTAARHDWPETVVAHTSGALGSSVLEPLSAEGASVLSFHPLQTVTGASSPSVLDDAYVGIEGNEKAVSAGIELAVGLGLRYIVLSSDAKVRYHLAATMASNFFVTLIGMVHEVLASLDIDREDGQAMMEPLVRGTLGSLGRSTPEEALTGAVVRGDLSTLKEHGAALRKHLPHLVPAYASMTIEAVRLGVRSGRLDPERAEEVLELMQKLVTTPLPSHGGSGASSIWRHTSVEV